MGLEYLVIIFFCGLGTAIIGKAKGSSFFIWFLVGAVLPILGLVAVILYRSEKTEPERQCPNCQKARPGATGPARTTAWTARLTTP